MRWQKQIACFLLAVFSLAILPAQTFHALFADHKDAAENHCRFYHKELGRHVESKESHCDIFKTNAPVYNAASVNHTFQAFAIVASPYKVLVANTRPLAASLTLPARAPPTL